MVLCHFHDYLIKIFIFYAYYASRFMCRIDASGVLIVIEVGLLTGAT